MDTAPSWPEILFLMVHGPDLTMRGRIRHGDGDEGRSFAFSRREGDPRPVFVHGSYDVIDAWRSGNCLRVADPDGQVRLITDGTTAWTFTDDAERPAESPHRNVGFGLSGTDLLVRTDAERWLHDDFTHPTGPPVAVGVWNLGAGLALYLLGDTLYRRVLRIRPSRLRLLIAALALVTVPLGLTFGVLAQVATCVLLLQPLWLVERKYAIASTV